MYWSQESATKFTSTPIYAGMGGPAGMFKFAICHNADKHQWSQEGQSEDMPEYADVKMTRQRCACGGLRFVVEGPDESLQKMFDGYEKA